MNFNVTPTVQDLLLLKNILKGFIFPASIFVTVSIKDESMPPYRNAYVNRLAPVFRDEDEYEIYCDRLSNDDDYTPFNELFHVEIGKSQFKLLGEAIHVPHFLPESDVDNFHELLLLDKEITYSIEKYYYDDEVEESDLPENDLEGLEEKMKILESNEEFEKAAKIKIEIEELKEKLSKNQKT